jgi:quinol monooxygenase YgiN
MVKIIIQYNVPVEKQEVYLQSTMEKIKPFWESHGCLSYEVWQRSDDEKGFIKEMVFQDGASMKKTLSLKESEPIKALFFQFATDVVRMTCERKV